MRSRQVMTGIVILACLLHFSTGTVARADPARQEGTGGQPLFSAPVLGALVRGFDPPAQAWLAGHRGVDLSASLTEPVRAAGAGTVAFAGVVVDRPLISIDHPIGIRTTYEPVIAVVAQGEEVEQGQIIGTIAAGNDHCPGVCLHWGARIGADHYIDPMALIRPIRFRLLPPQPW